MLSIIIVSYNTKKILKKALTKVFEQTDYTDFEVIVVDNNSHDDSCKMVKREFPQAKLISSSVNGGFAAGNNLGIEQARGDYILLLNPDAYVFPDSIRTSVEFMEDNPKTGIMGPQLIGEDGALQPSARKFPTPWEKLKVLSGYESRYSSFKTFYDFYQDQDREMREPRNVDWVPGTYFLIRRQVIEEIGNLDEIFFMYFEEVDYCWRAKRAGWEITFNPSVTIIHLGGQSSLASKKEICPKSRQLLDILVNSEYDYYRKNSGVFTMLLAAGVEIAWRTLVYLKNSLIRTGSFAMKASESKMSIHLIWLKIRRELSFN